jgi:hypothetical protein
MQTTSKPAVTYVRFATLNKRRDLMTLFSSIAV